MWKKLALKLTVRFLRGAELSSEDRALLTACVLDRLNALPAGAILKKDTDGTLMVNGKRVNAKMAFALNSSAKRVLNERAFKLVNEQVRFEAVSIGIHQGLTPDQVLFAKSALWQIGEHVKALEELSGNAPQDIDDLDDDD